MVDACSVEPKNLKSQYRLLALRWLVKHLVQKQEEECIPRTRHAYITLIKAAQDENKTSQWNWEHCHPPNSTCTHTFSRHSIV